MFGCDATVSDSFGPCLDVGTVAHTDVVFRPQASGCTKPLELRSSANEAVMMTKAAATRFIKANLNTLVEQCFS